MADSIYFCAYHYYINQRILNIIIIITIIIIIIIIIYMLLISRDHAGSRSLKTQDFPLYEGNRSFNKEDGNGKHYARKQWSDWLNEEKQSCFTCGTHFSTILWRILPNDNVEFPNFNVNTQQLTFHFLYFLQRVFYQSICSVLCQQ